MRNHRAYYISGIVVAIFVVGIPPIANAQIATPPIGCPPGTRPATPNDPVVLNGTISVGTCYDPSDVVIGQDVEQAKQYLNSLPKRTLSNCAPPIRENIMSLNDTFAVCAANFFKAYTRRYGTVYITSAFRDNTPGSAGDGSVQSANACADGALNSNHTRGVAIDVNPGIGSSYKTMWEFASQNPQFGVCFPHQDGRTTTNYVDRPHMILAGIGGKEAAACARQGVVKACNGLSIQNLPPPPEVPDREFIQVNYGQSYDEPTYYDYPQYVFSDASLELNKPKTPTIDIMKLFSGLFGGLKSGSSDSQTSKDLSGQNPQICEPKFSCTSNVVYYHTSTCTRQVYEACQYGCAPSGTSCAPQPSNPPGSGVNTTFDPTPVSESIDLGAGLNPDTTDIATLQAPTPSLYASGTVALSQPIYASPQTFTSGDLANNPSPDFAAQQQQNGFIAQILTSMKNTLLSVLNYLKPFGGNPPR